MASVPVWREAVGKRDRLEIDRLVRATGFFSAEEQAIAVELIDERLAKGEASGYFFLFAEAEGRMLGYACFGPIPGSAHSFDLYWIVVDPAAQRKGLGRELLQKAERLMALRGARRVYADTSSRPQYAPTRTFYLACGFTREALLADFYAAGDGKVIFSKVLDN